MKLAAMVEADYVTVPADDPMPEKITSEEQLRQVIAQLEIQMREAAKKFEFERAAGLRDRIRALQQRELGGLFTLLALPDSAAAAPAPSPAAVAAPQAALAPTAPPVRSTKSKRG